MKFLIVDLYGDGKDLRVIKDTKRNRKKVLDWDKGHSETLFSNFCTKNKIENYEVDCLYLGPN